MTDHINIPSNPADQKKVQQAVHEMANCLQRIADEREAMKDIAEDIKEKYGIEPKYLRKAATALHKHNYSAVLTEYESFEAFYEIIVEGKGNSQAAA